MYDELSNWMKIQRANRGINKLIEGEKQKYLTPEEISRIDEAMKEYKNEFTGFIGQVGSLLEISHDEYFSKMSRNNLTRNTNSQ